MSEESADGTVACLKEVQTELPERNCHKKTQTKRRWNCHEKTQTELSRENADGTVERERKLYDFFMRIEEEENENNNDKTIDGKEAAVLSANDFLNQQFVSYEEAYECYVRYAKCVRFGVREGGVAADSTGNYVRRKFLYNRAGVREKKCYATTKHALRDYRNNEIVAEFKTINGEHVPITCLHSLERHAASMYTREIFWEILEEIKSVAALDIVWSGSRSTTSEYKIIKYGRPDHEYIVYMIKILRKWCVNVKYGIVMAFHDGERSILMRIGALSVATSRMIYLGGRKLSHFRYTMNEICRVTKDLEAKLEQTILPEKGNKVGDPSVAKSKGAPKVQKDENKRRQCSNCNQTGHTKRKCIEKIAEKDVQHNDRMVREDEFEDGVESVCIPNDQVQVLHFLEEIATILLLAMKLPYMVPFPVIDDCYRP
ncbi:hypothetical protein Ahy_B01g056749 [Arachis hypogaea]|uniref:CCHC-type domain-containing protein n=1 Tax=Arachis hypogaea TaxID=3818 RepID=A0A445AZI7_ARAHY|nr:hypothetical protein Ahy_B01g056749 [Arachis hypogaea]